MKSVSSSRYAMVPNSSVPRSTFKIETGHKTTFDAGLLIPIYLEEILPGDTYKLKMTAFGRMATPIFPVMDNLYLDTFFFFVPNRLVWTNWVRMMGEQDNPGASIAFIVPTLPCSAFGVGTTFDYFGLPITGQVVANDTRFNVLPFRGYNLIYNTWFRDQNMVFPAIINTGDAGDTTADFPLRRRGKRPDYFTTALPFLQKGVAATLPLGTTANVLTNATSLIGGARPAAIFLGAAAGGAPVQSRALNFGAGSTIQTSATVTVPANDGVYPSNLFADLSTATAATINQLRQAIAIQQLLELDARGGTRYTEQVRAQFGVISPDARLQRPEYLGGGTVALNVNPIAQTSGTGLTGGTAPLGTLSAFATTSAQGMGFTQSFTEHGFVIGLACVRADLNYQQGLRKLWSRSTRYDYYTPPLANLGEQSVLMREIYCTGATANDTVIFGYQARWEEYRYHPPQITGLFRSTSPGTLDAWHLAQRFLAPPTLNDTFINETPPLSRVLAVGTAANGAQIIFDSFFQITAVRPLPMYSIPGMGKNL